MRFYAGLLVGLLPLGAYFGYQYFSGTTCQGRCGAGTRCERERCVVVVAASPTATAKKKTARRRRRRRAKHSPDKLLTASAAERRQVSRGPRLQQTDRVDLTRPEGGGTTKELSEGEVTARLRRKDGRIVRCIDNARGRHDLGASRVEVSFRIERSGRVSGVRVEAPRLLMRAGIHGCVERVIKGLHFPGSSRALVMTYPYSLD